MLYRQHTEDTGQPFEGAAVQRVFALTAGPPWLVNALAREIIGEMAGRWYREALEGASALEPADQALRRVERVLGRARAAEAHERRSTRC